MKKKLLSLALVLVMALTLLPTAAFAEGLEEEGETPPIETPAPEEKKDTAPETPAPETTPTETTPETPATQPENNQPTALAPNTVLTTAPASNDPSGGGTPDPTATCAHTTRELVPEVPAKCETTGTEAYYKCTTTEGCTATFKEATGGTSPYTPATLPALGHQWNISVEPSKCTRTGCNETCNHSGQTGNKCDICQKPLPVSTTPTPCDHTSLTLQNGSDAKAATCNADGVKKYYKCTCGKYFIDDARNTPLDSIPTADQLKIPATPNTHRRPASPVFTPADADETYHYFTCADCSKRVSESHSFSGNTCTVCSYTRRTTPSPYNYIDISSAYVSSYSFTVTWASDLPEGTRFDIYLDNTWQTNVSPSKSGNYFSTTVSTSSYLDDSYYYVAVYQYGDHTVGDSVKVYGRYYDRDHYYWDGYWEDGYWHPSYRPDYNTTPSTNSSGIPYASQVTGRYSASEAIRILRNTNATRLQNELMSSSSARSSYDSLERAVKSANNVSVSVSTDRSGVPSALRTGSGVQISGAAFNASSTNSTVRLVVDAPSVSRYVGHGYQFSMSLTGVGNDSSLDVPVVVSMPLPSDINSNFVRVLHYHNSSVPTVITPQVSGGRIRFTLTGFSDFVITDNGVPYTYVSDGLGGYYFPVNQVVVDRRSLAEEPLTLSVVPTGYVYSDVTGTYWASNAIAWAQTSGLMTGYYDGSFRPYSGTTRQELWMVLARLSGASPATMQAAREWAVNAGITDGRNPEAPLSHQQMITMLYRYASYRGMNLTAPTTNLSLYRDSASVSPYARTPMAWAINRGIVNGNGTGYLNPQNIATRADFAVYLYRFVQ